MNSLVGFLSFVSLIFFPSCQTMESNKSNDKNRVDQQQILFVGTYTQREGHVNGQAEGIYSCRMDEEGSIDIVTVYKNITNPSYLAVYAERDLLFAVSEVVLDNRRISPEIVSFKINEDFSLTEINRVPALGGGPCYISINVQHEMVLVANYVGGNVVMYTIDTDGSLTEPNYNFQSEGSGPHSNQGRAHAHYVNSHPNGLIYATDLGTDHINAFHLQDTFELHHQFSLPPGSGPRHLAFHPNGEFIYCLNELSGMIQSIRIGPDGRLNALQLISSIDPEKESAASSADIVVTADGQYVYASNRADHDNISAFQVDARSGQLSLIDRYSAGGDTPRAIALSPDGTRLLVANQDTGNIYVYDINKEDGTLNHAGINNQIPTPVCIKFAVL